MVIMSLFGVGEFGIISDVVLKWLKFYMLIVLCSGMFRYVFVVFCFVIDGMSDVVFGR